MFGVSTDHKCKNMKHAYIPAYHLLASFLLLTAFSGLGSGPGFSDANVDYSFELPDAKWKMTVKPSVTIPNVEYVFTAIATTDISRCESHVPKDAVLTDVIQRRRAKAAVSAGICRRQRGELSPAFERERSLTLNLSAPGSR